ncbi:MAG: hypothetical protein EKK52_17760 [Burkholderiales bacterium]|nr:MAG: hypothetical protein EKK52_17760 [Burkholderiales bacterium]
MNICSRRLPPAGFVLLLCGLILQGCAGAQPSRTPVAADPLVPLWREVGVQIGDAACDSDSQCHVIGVGAKACGGPNSYLAWSSKSTQEAALRQAVERHALAQRAALAASGMASNCLYVPEPGVQCRAQADGRRACQLVAAGSAAAN